MQKSDFLNKLAKKTIRDRLFMFKILKSAYQKLVIYPVLCKLVKSWGIESIGKLLYSEVKFPKNTKKVIILINLPKKKYNRKIISV